MDQLFWCFFVSYIACPSLLPNLYLLCPVKCISAKLDSSYPSSFLLDAMLSPSTAISASLFSGCAHSKSSYSSRKVKLYVAILLNSSVAHSQTTSAFRRNSTLWTFPRRDIGTCGDYFVMIFHALANASPSTLLSPSFSFKRSWLRTFLALFWRTIYLYSLPVNSIAWWKVVDRGSTSLT